MQVRGRIRTYNDVRQQGKYFAKGKGKDSVHLNTINCRFRSVSVKHDIAHNLLPMMTTPTSPSLVLFDHDTIENTVLKDRNVDAIRNIDSPSPLHNGTAATAATTNIFDAPTPQDMQKVPAAPIYIFAVIPIILFAILVIASCYLRKRLASFVENAEVRERHKQCRLKEEQRNKLVEKALVTTKVKFLPKAEEEFVASRGRASTVGTLGTLSSSSGDIIGDLSRRSSVESSAESIGDEMRDVEQGGVHVNSTVALTADNTNQDAVPTSNEYSENSYSEGEKDTTNLYSSPDWLQQNEECAICLEPYRENDDISYSKYQNCNHAFHTRCIASWLKDKFRNDCPCCRGPYLQSKPKEDKNVSAENVASIDGAEFTVSDGV